MTACLKRIKEEVVEWVHRKTIIPERQEEVREKAGIITRMREDREDWRLVLNQLKPKAMHSTTHY